MKYTLVRADNGSGLYADGELVATWDLKERPEQITRQCMARSPDFSERTVEGPLPEKLSRPRPVKDDESTDA